MKKQTNVFMKQMIVVGLWISCNFSTGFSQETIKPVAAQTFKRDYLFAKSIWQSILTHKIQSTSPDAVKALNKLNIDYPLLDQVIAAPIDYLELYFNLRQAVNGQEVCTRDDLSKLEHVLYNVKNTELKKKFFNHIVKPFLATKGMTEPINSIFRDAELSINDEKFIATNHLLQSKYKRLEQKAIVPEFKLKDSKGNLVSSASFKEKVILMQVADNLDQQIAFERMAAKFKGDSSVVFLSIAMKGTKVGHDANNSIILPPLTPVNPTAFKEQFILTRLPRLVLIAKDAIFASHLNMDENLAVFVKIAKLQ